MEAEVGAGVVGVGRGEEVAPVNRAGPIGKENVRRSQKVFGYSLTS